ncbi:DUF6261 family protein [Aquimarina hainanensis]|uniref:DUF6261 family protein n=1 Tax=Aquimarina hainanensis TaxID=1578017 RepID=A0ABW5N9R3_9FLAO|nr:DUF6261 family protein [Aquimarina sp. TRL1]QKX03920.1 hypothetical protein HN014_03025 [Aquimarina sp. TRL1]
MNTPYLSRFRHGGFLQYMKDILSLLVQQDLNTLQLTTQKAALEAPVEKIDAAFQQEKGSTLTQEIILLDERRDRAIVGIKTLAEAYTYHFKAAVAEAGRAILSMIQAHGTSIQRMSYQEETATLDNIIDELENDRELVASVRRLHLESWVTELKSANTLFTHSYLERVEETAANQVYDIKELRKEATDAYRILMRHIEAHATLGNHEVYPILVNQIDVLAGQYNQVIENRAATKVSSQVVSSDGQNF